MPKTLVAISAFFLAFTLYATASDQSPNDLASLPAEAQASISAALARDLPGGFAQLAKLTASDATKLSFLGVSVAISGNTVAVGIGSTHVQGAVYIFVKPASGWSNMTQAAKLTASDGAVNDYVGYSVGFSGNTVVAGAPNTDGDVGAAYVFVKPASGWANMTETAKLTASGSHQGVGNSVAISGNTVVVGSPDYNVFGPGAALVYVKPATGWASMTQTATLTSSDGQTHDSFGSAVAMSGNTIVAGAQNRTEVYLFVG